MCYQHDDQEPDSIDYVCTHVLAALDFACNQQARLLPVTKGILYFAFSAPAELFAYECQIGNMPSYSSIYKTLWSLADQEARVTQCASRDPSKWGVMQLDNVQQWIPMQDLQIWHESRMLIGVVATYFEIDANLFIHGIADLDNKLVKILENKRWDVTVET
jgi:hypothetical protein